MRDHHRFLLAGHLTPLDFLDEQVALFDGQIAQVIADYAPAADPGNEKKVSAGTEATPTIDPPLAWEQAVALLDTIPGVGRAMAEVLVAEIGTDMRRFASAAHLASWARVLPGNNESADKRHSGRTGPGNTWLRSNLAQAAHAAVRVKDSYFAQGYRRLVAQRGAGARWAKALMAVAHRILLAV